VALLGGGNSAGQAAVFLASHARHVRLLVRGLGLSSTMSHYLIERIEGAPNITVLAETELVELVGPTSVCRASVGATDELGPRNTTRSRTCSSSPAPIR
jgi:thioredoxin reductase (NADPH)